MILPPSAFFLASRRCPGLRYEPGWSYRRLRRTAEMDIVVVGRDDRKGVVSQPQSKIRSHAEADGLYLCPLPQADQLRGTGICTCSCRRSNVIRPLILGPTEAGSSSFYEPSWPPNYVSTGSTTIGLTLCSTVSQK